VSAADERDMKRKKIAKCLGNIVELFKEECSIVSRLLNL
jgi:hypothetical protein